MDLQDDVNVETVYLIGDHGFFAFPTSTTILPEPLYLEHDQPEHQALACLKRTDNKTIAIIRNTSPLVFKAPI